MITVPIIGIYGTDTKLFNEIYEKVKDDFPEFLKSKFVYTGRIELLLPLSEDSDSYKYVMNMIKIYNLNVRFWERTYYSKTEESVAEFFIMHISHPLESQGTCAEDYGTIYTDCCPVCKIGGKPVTDVLVDRKFVKKYGIASLVPDIFVSKQVKWLLEQNGLTGIRFEYMVKDFKGREIPEYYCMTIDNILAPVNKSTILNYEPPAVECKECGKTIPYRQSACYYLKEDLKNINDFNLTYEFFDNWAERGIIVSRKVKEIFKRYKIRAWFEMLNVIE